MGLPRAYPMAGYPYAQNAEEEHYYQRVHYLASALLVFGAGEDVLDALGQVYGEWDSSAAPTAQLTTGNLTGSQRAGWASGGRVRIGRGCCSALRLGRQVA